MLKSFGTEVKQAHVIRVVYEEAEMEEHVGPGLTVESVGPKGSLVWVGNTIERMEASWLWLINIPASLL